jgi:hypothetical protein
MLEMLSCPSTAVFSEVDARQDDDASQNYIKRDAFCEQPNAQYTGHRSTAGKRMSEPPAEPMAEFWRKLYKDLSHASVMPQNPRTPDRVLEGGADIGV